MTRSMYMPEDFGNEVATPSGYYQPLEQGIIAHDGRRLLYTLGSACIEASCCGVGSWQYLRVEGYVAEGDPSEGDSSATHLEIETIEDESEKAAISKLLLDKYPGARIEFR